MFFVNYMLKSHMESFVIKSMMMDKKNKMVAIIMIIIFLFIYLIMNCQWEIAAYKDKQFVEKSFIKINFIGEDFR
jgi:hypothetical protein